MLPIILLLFSGLPAYAQSGSWTIAEAKGAVVVIDSRGTRPAVNGLALAPGATVRTQARSSAVLVRGREFVTLRQNAQIRIPDAERSRSVMQIIQDYGSALFNIGKQPNPHFGVETPYLAAVVKGTTFIITVGNDGATLQVTEGAVEASTPDGGARELILPGAVAMVAAGDTMRMVIEGDTRRVIDSPARPAGGPAAAAPAAVPGALAQGHGLQRVNQVIASSPGDVGSYSGGFASGEVAVIAAVVVAENAVRGSGDGGGGDNGSGNGPDGDGPGSGGDEGTGNNGNGSGNGGGNGTGNEGNGNGGNGGDDGGNDDGDIGPGNGNGNNGNGNGNGGGNGAGNEGNGNGNDGNNGNDDPGNAGGNGNGNGGGNDGCARGDCMAGLDPKVRDAGLDGMDGNAARRDGAAGRAAEEPRERPGARDLTVQP
jgi:hypothetical protein